MSKFEQTAKEVKTLIQSRYPILYITSDEREQNIIRILMNICNKGAFKKNLYLWDRISGFSTCNITEDGNIIDSKIKQNQENEIDLSNPFSALEWLCSENNDNDSIFLLREYHHYLHEPAIQRYLRRFAEYNAICQKKMIILLSTRNDGIGESGKIIPTELSNIITLMDWPYPDYEEIKNALVNTFIPNFNESLELANQRNIDLINKGQNVKLYDKLEFTDSEINEIIHSCKGMTIAQIDNATSKSMIIHKTLVPKTISLEKKQIIQKAGLAEYIESNEDLSSIGGLENLKKWLIQRKSILSDEARTFGCKAPNGVLLIGPWGSGKSTAAKAVIKEWGLPGVRIDASKIFNKFVGDSEQRIHGVLKLAESISPCILWWDEVEDLLSGGGSSASDGGTTSRVVGIISTWMSEHEGVVFNIFTANDIGDSPPKLFRKGRLDEIFVVDLPVKQERAEIFEIFIRKGLDIQGRSHLVDRINLDLLASQTQGFSGAEIMAAVDTALVVCFNEGKRELTTSDISEAIQNTIPFSCTMREKIMKIREWLKGRAIPASIHPPEDIEEISSYQVKHTQKINLDLSDDGAFQ